MTEPSSEHAEIARALGRLEGSLTGLRESQDDMRDALVAQMEAKHRENQQQNLSARETLERIEKAAADRARAHDAAITRVRTDLTADIIEIRTDVVAHDLRITSLEVAENHRQWLRSLLSARVRPLTALFWSAAGIVVAEGTHFLIR